MLRRLLQAIHEAPEGAFPRRYPRHSQTKPLQRWPQNDNQLANAPHRGRRISSPPPTPALTNLQEEAPAKQPPTQMYQLQMGACAARRRTSPRGFPAGCEWPHTRGHDHDHLAWCAGALDHETHCAAVFGVVALNLWSHACRTETGLAPPREMTLRRPLLGTQATTCFGRTAPLFASRPVALSPSGRCCWCPRRIVPGQVFVCTQSVPLASLTEGEQAVAHSSNHQSLMLGSPALEPARRQLGSRYVHAIWFGKIAGVHAHAWLGHGSLPIVWGGVTHQPGD